MGWKERLQPGAGTVDLRGRRTILLYNYLRLTKGEPLEFGIWLIKARFLSFEGIFLFYQIQRKNKKIQIQQKDQQKIQILKSNQEKYPIREPIKFKPEPESVLMNTNQNRKKLTPPKGGVFCL